MEIDLESGSRKGIRNRKEKKSPHINRKKREREPKSGHKLGTILLIVVLGILCVISLMRSDSVVQDEIVHTNYRDEVIDDTNISTRINGCTIIYDSTKWEQTDTGLQALCDTGYYTVTIYNDTLSGVTLEELQESTINAYDGMQGIEMYGKANYETEKYKRAEVEYGRIELNANNIVTGNGEITREIYIQPIGTDIYFGLTVKSYQTDGVDYMVYENDLENIIESLEM